MAKLKYKRVSLKLSGEAMGGGDVLDFDAIADIAAKISALNKLGVQVGITCGGGNIIRGGRSGKALERNRADHMGMLATTINSLALCDALEKLDVPCAVLSSVDMPRFCDTFSARLANAELSAGKVVIFAAGSGSPFVTTDTAAALRAAEIGADAMLLAKNIDAVYSADPRLDENATRYTELTYNDVIKNELKATDLTAIMLCRENSIPILVFAMNGEDNLIKAVRGENVGTLIH
ncbi:MAG: UMP kinase [Clostridia bacterium]